MKKFFCILLLSLCLTLPAMAEDLLPDFSTFIGNAPASLEQTITGSCVSTRFTGQADTIIPAIDAYLVRLREAGLKQQLSLPTQQGDCSITLYAFRCDNPAIPTMTCADAALGWVVSETHLLLDLRIYADGTATVEILCRPEFVSAVDNAPIEPSAAATSCADCSSQGIQVQSCTDCAGQGHTSASCNACKGDGQRSCSSCGGDGQRKCSSCSGSGHHSSGAHHGKHHGSKSCTSCGGDGLRRCSSCSGKGYHSCHSCSGRGVINASCSSCTGTGRRYASCGTCGGSGCIK